MPKNEDGEFELILGNRQLISVFLIVVILLGVFFSMGYIVGRNSAPAAAETAQNKAPASSSATAETTRPSEPAGAPSDSAVAPHEETATRPEKETPREEPPAAPPVQRTPPQKSKPSPAPAPEPAATPAAPASGEPGPGQYWQVVATARPDAEIITEALTKKGFHAVMAPAPKDGVFRVLVGPLKDPAAQAQTRTSLEAAGFKNPIVRKY